MNRTYAPRSRRGGRYSPDSEASSSSLSRESTPRFGRGGYYRGGRGGYVPSRKWVSPETAAHDEYRVMRNAMQRLFPKSAVAKMTEAEYAQHKKDLRADYAEELEASRAGNDKYHGRSWTPLVDLEEDNEEDNMPKDGAALMAGLINPDNRSAVLCLPTIWCKNWRNGKEEVAPWPTPAEMRWEGDDRAKTDCGRFLGLPREPGHPQIHWQQLNVIPQYPLDEVARIPTIEDTHAPVEEIPVLRVFDFINRDLLERIDKNNIYLYLNDWLDHVQYEDPVLWLQYRAKLDLANVPEY
jgi:hypothetical protein